MNIMKSLAKAIAVQIIVSSCFSVVDESIRVFIREKGQEFFASRRKKNEQ